MASNEGANETAAAPAATTIRQIPTVCPGHTRPLAEVQFCSVMDEVEERTLLVSACHDRMPMLRDGTTGDWIGTFVGHKGAVWSCHLDRLGYLAATASGDFSVKLWDAVTGDEICTFPHKHVVKCVDFSPDSTRLATGGHEGLLRVYNLEKAIGDDNKDSTKQNYGQCEPDLSIAQHSQKTVKVCKCLWLDNNVIMAAGSDGSIRFWDVTSASTAETPIRTLTVTGEVRDMELLSLQKQQLILTVAAGNTVSFFDLATYQLLHCHQMPVHFREEGGASLHPDGSKFVAGGSDLWVRVFDFQTGKELECHKGHHGPIRCVRYAPDGKTYATGSEDGTIRLWKTHH